MNQRINTNKSNIENMKNQYILMAVAAGLSMTACSDDFLEVTSPTDTFIEEYYTTEKSMDDFTLPYAI